MTRTEAIDILKCLAWHRRPSEEEIEEVLKIAINSLKVDEMYQLEKEDADEFIPKSVIEDIRAEIQAIEMEGRVDDRTRFIRGGKEVKNLVLKIIDKHISGKDQNENSN